MRVVQKLKTGDMKPLNDDQAKLDSFEISRRGKVAAERFSPGNFAAWESQKTQRLHEKIQRALHDIANGNTHDGEALFQALLDGKES